MDSYLILHLTGMVNRWYCCHTVVRVLGMENVREIQKKRTARPCTWRCCWWRRDVSADALRLGHTSILKSTRVAEKREVKPFHYNAVRCDGRRRAMCDNNDRRLRTLRTGPLGASSNCTHVHTHILQKLVVALLVKHSQPLTEPITCHMNTSPSVMFHSILKHVSLQVDLSDF